MGSPPSVVGDKAWWVSWLSRNPKLIVTDNQLEYEAYLQVTNKELYNPLTASQKPEAMLTDRFLRTNIFSTINQQEKVRLGKDAKRIDVLAGADDSTWVIECKEPQSKTATLDVGQVGQAIGQVVIYTYLYKLSYKERRSRKIMPVICTWLLGSGAIIIKRICQMFGVTLIEVLVQTPYGVGDNVVGTTARIHYLNEASPRPFCEDWKDERFY